MQQDPENPNPRHNWMGDMISGIDRVDSTLIDVGVSYARLE